MTKPVYDLEDRTLRFATKIRLFVKTLPRTDQVEIDGRQLLRSSGSIGANYREANEKLSKKDFVYRMKICRKEAKETEYWLRLIDSTIPEQYDTTPLIKEAIELRKIMSAIINKSI